MLSLLSSHASVWNIQCTVQPAALLSELADVMVCLERLSPLIAGNRGEPEDGAELPEEHEDDDGAGVGVGDPLCGDLHLLVRNFTLEADEAELLRKVIGDEGEAPNAHPLHELIKGRNEIRRRLRRCFRSVHLHTLPPPHPDCGSPHDDPRFVTKAQVVLGRISDSFHAVERPFPALLRAVDGNGPAPLQTMVDRMATVVDGINEGCLPSPASIRQMMKVERRLAAERAMHEEERARLEAQVAEEQQLRAAAEEEEVSTERLVRRFFRDMLNRLRADAFGD